MTEVKGISVATGNVTEGGLRLKKIEARGSSECPLVTVITAVYNGGSCIRNCIESVLAQDYPNLEYIVMDGGSRDDTVNILREYDDRIALWRSERDSGIYDAWNKALAEARGEWISFLGADDEYLPGAVSAYMELARKSPAAEFLSSRIAISHPSGYVKVLGKPWTWKEFSRKMCTPHVGAMHRRRLFDKVGVYDTSYRIVADYELLLRAGSHLQAAYMPEVTVNMKAGGMSTTTLAQRETTRAKIATGARNKILASADFIREMLIFPLRPPVRYVLRTLQSAKRSRS